MSVLQIAVLLGLGLVARAQVINFGDGPLCILKPNVSASEVTFTLYNHLFPTGVLLSDANLNQVNVNLRTIFVIHGWLQAGTQGWILQMKDEYLKVADANVIVVDWSKYSFCYDYFPTVEVVPEVGTIVGDFIWKLVSNEYARLANTQINGFSIGAHIAGVAGQQIQLKSGGRKIYRINGLDANALGFEGAPINKRLDVTDADFVQAFHTSSHGMQERYGTIDVYFNSQFFTCGLAQPGCPLYPGVPVPSNPLLPIVFCNHIRAAVYLIYSISQPSASFLAVRCSCVGFSFKACTGPKITVGEYVSQTAQDGSYFLNTRCFAPYGLSNAGTVGGNADYWCIL